MGGIEHKIDPAHLMYQAVRSHPLINVSELDALIFSGLCLFVDNHGIIRLSEEDRTYLCQSLSVSPQQMSNTISRLLKKCAIYRQHEQSKRNMYNSVLIKGQYRLDAQLMDLTRVPKKMTKPFTIKYIPDGIRRITPGPGSNLPDVDTDYPEFSGGGVPGPG